MTNDQQMEDRAKAKAEAIAKFEPLHRFEFGKCNLIRCDLCLRSYSFAKGYDAGLAQAEARVKELESERDALVAAIRQANACISPSSGHAEMTEFAAILSEAEIQADKNAALADAEGEEGNGYETSRILTRNR